MEKDGTAAENKNGSENRDTLQGNPPSQDGMPIPRSSYTRNSHHAMGQQPLVTIRRKGIKSLSQLNL